MALGRGSAGAEGGGRVVSRADRCSVAGIELFCCWYRADRVAAGRRGATETAA